MDSRHILKTLVAKSMEALVFCNILILVNIVFISFFQHDAVIVLGIVSLVTFFEGGIGLTVGGLFVIASGPTITKFSEKTFGGQSYSGKRARESEGRAQLIIFFSLFLILFGYLLGI